MNELIEKLLDEAELDIVWDQDNPDYKWVEGSEESLLKFAELIVRECIDIVEQDMKLAHIQMIPLTLEKYANGRLKEKIEEHFGVE